MLNGIEVLSTEGLRARRSLALPVERVSGCGKVGGGFPAKEAKGKYSDQLNGEAVISGQWSAEKKRMTRMKFQRGKGRK